MLPKEYRFYPSFDELMSNSKKRCNDVTEKKSSKKEESSCKFKPAPFYFSSLGKGSFVLPKLGEEIVLEHKFIDALSEKTGIYHENLWQEKSRFDLAKNSSQFHVQKSFDTWTGFSSNKVGAWETARLISESTGMDCEAAYTRLTMPKVSYY